MKKAFTLVEVLIVLTLLVIIFGMVALYSGASQVRADLNSQVAIFVSHARLQQSEAAAGKNDQSFGIHIESGAYTLFEGSAYSSSDPGNNVMDLPPTLEIQNILLNGGGPEVLFLPPYGETNNFGTLNFYSTSLDQSITITISSLGTLNY